MLAFPSHVTVFAARLQGGTTETIMRAAAFVVFASFGPTCGSVGALTLPAIDTSAPRRALHTPDCGTVETEQRDFNGLRLHHWTAPAEAEESLGAAVVATCLDQDCTDTHYEKLGATTPAPEVDPGAFAVVFVRYSWPVDCEARFRHSTVQRLTDGGRYLEVEVEDFGPGTAWADPCPGAETLFAAHRVPLPSEGRLLACLRVQTY